MVTSPLRRLCLAGGGQDHAVEELKPFGLLTSRYRCEELVVKNGKCSDDRDA